MERAAHRDTLYRVGAVSYTHADVLHRLLGKHGYGSASDLWLLNDALIEAVTTILGDSHDGRVRRTIAPLTLCALLGTGTNGVPHPPKRDTALRTLSMARHHGGVLHLGIGHWVFVHLEVSPERIAVEFVDSLGSQSEALLASAAEGYFARYLSSHPAYVQRCVRMLEGPLQHNMFDCGVLALDNLRRFLTDQKREDPLTGGVISKTAALRVSFAYMLTERRYIVSGRSLASSSPSSSTSGSFTEDIEDPDQVMA